MKKAVQPTTEEFNALFCKACEDHQNKKYLLAEKGYQQLISYFPDAPVLNYNLGLLFFETKEYVRAIESFLLAAEGNPDDSDIFFNLALSYKNRGDIEAAIAMYYKVLHLEPESMDALYNLAGCYREQKRYDEAALTYLKVLKQDSKHLSANNNLAFVYKLQGKTGEAIRSFKKVLKIHPGHEAAGHMLAALTGADVSSPPEKYVQEVFDNYSGYYETSLLEELEYGVPEKMKSIVTAGVNWKKSFQYGLDLGCGTGLCGAAFFEMPTRLDGLDLAPKMIEIARSKNIYEALHISGINEFLSSEVGPFDLVLASDVFAYLGELQDTLHSVYARTTEDVLFCFSTETISGSGYKLRSTGRFGHSTDYIEKTASDTGWKVLETHRTSLRKEKEAWVEGNLWFMGKDGGL